MVIGVGPYGGGMGVIGDGGPFSKEIELEAASDDDFLFTIQHRNTWEHAVDLDGEGNGFLFDRVEKSEGEFAIEKLEFRPPGKVDAN